jgi:hypothetical protein
MGVAASSQPIIRRKLRIPLITLPPHFWNAAYTAIPAAAPEAHAH